MVRRGSRRAAGHDRGVRRPARRRRRQPARRKPPGGRRRSPSHTTGGARRGRRRRRARRARAAGHVADRRRRTTSRSCRPTPGCWNGSLANLIDNALASRRRARTGADHRRTPAPRAPSSRSSTTGPGVPGRAARADLHAVPAPRRPQPAVGVGLGLWPSRAASPRRWTARCAADDPRRRPDHALAAAPAALSAAMTRVLVVDDEPGLLRALAINLARASTTSTSRPTATPRSPPPPASHPTSSCSTSACPTWTARGDPRACAAGPARRSSCCPPGRTRATRSTPSTPAPTTTSPSRSAWTSCSRGCARRCAAPARRADAPVVETARLHRRSRRQAGPTTADGDPIRLTPTEWHLLEVLVRHEGKLVGQRQLLQEVWGPAYETETNYLRVYIAQLRRKLEPEPVQAPSPHHRTRHRIPLRRLRAWARNGRVRFLKRS